MLLVHIVAESAVAAASDGRRENWALSRLSRASVDICPSGTT
jgi:hypothetical protein